MNRKALILSIPMILAVFLLAGWFVLHNLKKGEESQKPLAMRESSPKVTDADFVKYNKTLARHKVTGVTDIEGPYKKVTVSNGEITFSFEVPDKWLTETRNSGEVEMNEEELREFLGTIWNGDIRSEKVCGEAKIFDVEVGDFIMKETCSYPTGNYWDFTWDMVKDMPYSEMKSYYDKKRDEFSPGFPNATVSSGMKKAIWYTDMGWDQVNFYILDKKKDAHLLSGVIYDRNLIDSYRKKNEEILRKLPRNEKGDPDIDKGSTYGLFFSIERGDKVLRIWKEAYVEGEFEEGFKHLIETLSFE